MNIVDAYRETGSYRAAGALCGVDPKTVKRVVERAALNRFERLPARARARNTDGLAVLIAERVEKTEGRISAKRLLPSARAEGYGGSARNFRRAVARAKQQWRRRRRQFRPWVPKPGEHLLIDWGKEDGLLVFCAVVAWSRWRFVRFASDERRSTTLRMLAECFELIGGVPQVVLSDRMGCLRQTTIAGLVVPHPDYVRFAAHYGFRPDFCEAADPQSKGQVERLVGYAKRDLMVGLGPFSDPAAANEMAPAWCGEVNGRVHSETCKIPAEQLRIERGVLRPLPGLRATIEAGVVRKVDRLATIRFGSARYSVPARLIGTQVRVAAEGREIVIVAASDEIARHPLVAPGEVAINDAHYGGTRSAPVRAIRPRSAAEKAFLELGAAAEDFLRAAAAAGTSRLAAEIAGINDLAAAWERDKLVAALERATTYRRFGAADVSSILQAGAGVATPRGPGEPLSIGMPPVPVRALSDYAPEVLS